MKLLLDTCTFLWIATGSKRLSKTVQRLHADPANELFLSAVSAWEMGVKYSMGRLEMREPPRFFIPEVRAAYSIQELPLSEEDVLYVEALPKIHADPFDRMLICQAVIHGLTIATPDPFIKQYAVRTVW